MLSKRKDLVPFVKINQSIDYNEFRMLSSKSDDMNIIPGWY